MKILIIGGNRFFGLKLALRLLQRGDEVTLLNRGQKADGMGGHVQRLQCDRNDFDKMHNLLKSHHWDVVYDQVCYDYETAQKTCELFSGKTKHYICTSSQSVYGPGQSLIESDFQAEAYSFLEKEKRGGDYAEGKRQMEVAFVKYANFDFSLVRFPIVVGEDDYTKRIHFHVERIKNSKSIYFPNIEAKLSLISSNMAAKALELLSEKPILGAINIASPHPISLKEIVRGIEMAVQKKFLLADRPGEGNHSPYGITSDWYMNTGKWDEWGMKMPEVSAWLPSVINEIAKNI